MSSAGGKKFLPGQIVSTRGVHNLISENSSFAVFVHQSLMRHLSGDWGSVCPEDWQANEIALMEGSRLLSAYKSEGQPKIWIITEADRSSTCILFPSEY